MKRNVVLAAVGVLMLTFLGACGSDGSQSAGENGSTEKKEKTKLLVAAAASLKNVYDEKLIPMFETLYPDISVEGTYDSSGKLQFQIEEGLAADVFMSAANKQMDKLNEEGLIAEATMTNLMENKIVLIAPSQEAQTMGSFEDIVSAEHIAIGDPASVPAGQYAQEALTNLSLWNQIKEKLSLGTNVTEVLNQVASGSAEAGIVYATDAASMAEQVAVIAEAPEGSVSKAIYPVAVVKASAHPEEAEKFVGFLKSREAIKVFESFGFSNLLR